MEAAALAIPRLQLEEEEDDSGTALQRLEVLRGRCQKLEDVLTKQNQSLHTMGALAQGRLP